MAILTYIRPFLDYQDRTLLKSVILTFFAHGSILGLISWHIYENSFASLKTNAKITTEEIENFFLEEADTLISESYAFLKEIQSKFPSKVIKNQTKKLEFIPKGLKSTSSNSYLNHTFEISQPFVDQETGLWSISFKVYAYNQDNIAIGSFLKAMNLREFSGKLRKSVQKDGVIFAIRDHEDKIILRSSNNKINQAPFSSFEHLDGLANNQKSSDGYTFTNKQVSYVKALKNQPYIIHTSIDYTSLLQEIKNSIFFQLSYILVSLVACLSVLFYFSYRKHRSSLYAQEILNNYYFNFALETIVDHVKDITPSSGFLIPKNKDTQANISIIKPRDLVKECLLILQNKINTHKVVINTSIKTNCLIEANSFQLSKIIVSLLSSCIEQNSTKKISISCTSDKAFFYLKIEDKSFFLNEDDRANLSRPPQGANIFLLNFKSILVAAKSLGINISFSERIPKGNTILIAVPLNSKTHNLLDEKPKIMNYENVIPLRN